MQYDACAMLGIVRRIVSDAGNEVIRDVYVKQIVEDGVKRTIFTITSETSEDSSEYTRKMGDYLPDADWIV